MTFDEGAILRWLAEREAEVVNAVQAWKQWRLRDKQRVHIAPRREREIKKEYDEAMAKALGNTVEQLKATKPWSEARRRAQSEKRNKR